MDPTLSQRVAVVFAGALSFGFYAFTFLICLRWLLFVDDGWRLRTTRNINWPIVVVAFLILACNLAYLLETFVWTMIDATHAVQFPGETFNKPEWTSILSCTVANANVLLADIVLIVRCWNICARSIPIIAFPSLMWIAALLCTILQIYLQVAHTKDPTIGPYTWASVNMTMGPGIVLMPFWISTVLLNAYASIVLIHRIYRATDTVNSRASASIEYLHFLIHVIAESGLLYFSITTAHFLVWFGTNEFATDIIAVLNAPIVGIAFNWFWIRIARRKASEAVKDTDFSAEVSTMRFEKASRVRSETIVGTLNDSSSMESSILVISGHSTAAESDYSRTLVHERVEGV